jgi:multidrug efflux pump subunit AcrA (membrane-fusion protein)
VVDRRIHTPGGVLAAGSPVLDLVPVDAPLVIEARVDPKDRDVVAPGQEASVRFTAFSQRVASSVRARVQAISADRLVDAATGQGWYRALIELVEDPGPALGGARLHPGMQATVMIVTGERTALAYLARPILASVQQALRED